MIVRAISVIDKVTHVPHTAPRFVNQHFYWPTRAAYRGLGKLKSEELNFISATSIHIHTSPHRLDDLPLSLPTGVRHQYHLEVELTFEFGPYNIHYPILRAD